MKKPVWSFLVMDIVSYFHLFDPILHMASYLSGDFSNRKWIFSLPGKLVREFRWSKSFGFCFCHRLVFAIILFMLSSCFCVHFVFDSIVLSCLSSSRDYLVFLFGDEKATELLFGASQSADSLLGDGRHSLAAKGFRLDLHNERARATLFALAVGTRVRSKMGKSKGTSVEVRTYNLSSLHLQ